MAHHQGGISICQELTTSPRRPALLFNTKAQKHKKLSVASNVLIYCIVMNESFETNTNQQTEPVHTRPDYSSDSEIESIESTCS